MVVVQLQENINQLISSSYLSPTTLLGLHIQRVLHHPVRIAMYQVALSGYSIFESYHQLSQHGTHQDVKSGSSIIYLHIWLLSALCYKHSRDYYLYIKGNYKNSLCKIGCMQDIYALCFWINISVHKQWALPICNAASFIYCNYYTLD